MSGWNVCPRCGLPYISIHVKRKGKRYYLAAYHGKDEYKRPVLCHLGPADSYVAPTHVMGAEVHGLYNITFSTILGLLRMLVNKRRREADSREHINERREILRRTYEELKYLLQQITEMKERIRSELEVWEREEEKTPIQPDE